MLCEDGLSLRRGMQETLRSAPKVLEVLPHWIFLTKW